MPGAKMPSVNQQIFFTIPEHFRSGTQESREKDETVSGDPIQVNEYGKQRKGSYRPETAVCSCPFCVYKTFGQKVQKRKGEKDGKEKNKNNAFCGGNDDSSGEWNLLCMESRKWRRSERMRLIWKKG